MTEKDLAEIEARANAATEGPWVVGHPDGGPDDGGRVEGIMSTSGRLVVETDSGNYPPKRNDAEFIAHARTDVPRLVAWVRELEAIQAAVQRLLQTCNHAIGSVGLDNVYADGDAVCADCIRSALGGKP